MHVNQAKLMFINYLEKKYLKLNFSHYTVPFHKCFNHFNFWMNLWLLLSMQLTNKYAMDIWKRTKIHVELYSNKW